MTLAGPAEGEKLRVFRGGPRSPVTVRITDLATGRQATATGASELAARLEALTVIRRRSA